MKISKGTQTVVMNTWTITLTDEEADCLRFIMERAEDTVSLEWGAEETEMIRWFKKKLPVVVDR